MAVITINNSSVPSTLTDRGDYSFPKAERLRTNGQGLAVVSPVRTLTWTFNYMTQTELAFWNTTVLSGADSLVCTGTNTFKDMHAATPGANTTFSSCVVDKPSVGSVVGGLYRDVTITIRNILA